MEQNTEASQAVDERQLFEGWCGAGRYRFVTLKRMSGERYVHPGVQADWEVWQARAALKAQPAPTEATAEPVMWFEAEASAKGQPLRHVIGSMLYSTRMHTTKPEVLNNALWPLYEHPAPTEAQGLSPVYAWLERSTRNSPSEVANAARTMMAFYQGAEFPEAAQGEDSARLDDLATIRDLDRLGMELGAKLAQMVGHLDNGVEYLPRDAIMIAVTDWRSAWSKNAKARKPINRARASAETGGVKP